MSFAGLRRGRDRFVISTSRYKNSILIVQNRLIVVNIVSRRGKMHLIILARLRNMAQKMTYKHVCRLLRATYAAFKLWLWDNGRMMVLGLNHTSSDNIGCCGHFWECLHFLFAGEFMTGAAVHYLMLMNPEGWLGRTQVIRCHDSITNVKGGQWLPQWSLQSGKRFLQRIRVDCFHWSIIYFS